MVALPLPSGNHALSVFLVSKEEVQLASIATDGFKNFLLAYDDRGLCLGQLELFVCRSPKGERRRPRTQPHDR